MREQNRGYQVVGWFVAATLVMTSAFASNPVELTWSPGFDGGRAVKAVEAAIILWDITSTNKQQPQIEVFDPTGNRMHQIAVLRSVSEAESVGIVDVAVDNSGNVAVAAVFAKPECRREPVLLLYSSRGQLQNAIGLADGRSISRLEFDEDGSIWALGRHSGTLDPNEVPILFHYDGRGAELGSFVSRGQFLRDAEFTEEGPSAGGAPGLGLAGDFVWFWLPASRRLATIRKDGSNLAIYDTGLPELAGPGGSDPHRTEVNRVALLPSGDLLAEATIFDSSAVVESGLFRWTRSQDWTKIDSPQIPLGTRLLNATKDGKLLLQQASLASGGFLVHVVTLQ